MLAFRRYPVIYRIRFHNERGNFEVGTLLLFSVVYFFVSCVTYGVAVPSGLFVPCILTGTIERTSDPNALCSEVLFRSSRAVRLS